jgi:hypothetical protein
MLERQALLLGPWAEPAAPGAPPQRRVRDAATGEALGFVARRRAGPRWLRWLLPVVLDVYETEDASLLCTFRSRKWVGNVWEVYDADERRVGSFDRGAVRDACEARLAEVRRSGGRDGGRFVSPAGLELADFGPAAGGVLLTFTAAAEGNPFARMALLGATLVLGG